jgi:hypothetical protein
MRTSFFLFLVTVFGASCTDDVIDQPDQLVLPGDMFYPESLIADGDGALYVGSLVTGQVVAFADGETEPTVVVGASSGVVGVAGVTIRGDELWLCSIDATFQRPTEVRSFTLDGIAGATYPLPPNRFCNDLAFDAGGALYITDSFNGTVLRLAPSATTPEPWIDDPALAATERAVLGTPHRLVIGSAPRRATEDPHAGEHREDERDGARVSARRRDQPGSRTRTGEPPSDPEQRGARDERQIDVLPRREVEDRVEPRIASSLHDEPGQECIHDDRTTHDERERRIPRGGIEEAADLVRQRHARDDETRPEQRAAREREHDRHDTAACSTGSHDSTPRSVAAIAPVVMKVATATRERCDRRESPHTPCPLVHPLPRRAPYPTRRPPAIAIGQDAPSVAAGTTTPAKSPAPSRPARNA